MHSDIENLWKLRVIMPDFSERLVYNRYAYNNFVRSVNHGRYCDIMNCSPNAGSNTTGYCSYQNMRSSSTLSTGWADVGPLFVTGCYH
jgi:hypothetical protein